MQQRRRGHITQADQAANDYYYIPFTLPTAARRLHVRYHYSAAISSDNVTGGNVIDLGLFDPRGREFPGGAGFRGWSGSARQAFTIGLDNATPGYLPGPLPAGEYHVILGLYRIWEQGADYEIIIEADLDDEAPAAFVDRAQAAVLYPPSSLPGEATHWLCGDLQSHTDHSDAKGSLAQLIEKARALKLAFLAVTDHNTISHHPHLAALEADDLLLLYGQEVTTYYGHMNVWGTRQWCDFRAKTAADLAAIVDFAHTHGGLCSVNHPKTGGPAWEYGFDLPIDTVEVWQGPWPYRNAESLALWDRLLVEGHVLHAVGGSDYHCPAGEETNLLRLGQPTTWVLAKERSHRGILEALYAGRATMSAHPQGPRLLLAATADAHSALMGESLLVAAGEQFDTTVTVWNGAGYELQIVADGQVVKQESL
ncbi:MAG: CehA/McbA family metallohydrolase, partial [Caldilineaceae bacterium]|nr:CehA/McbA family metallohydrolase [Caldilineaceae bacterium]